MNSYTARKVENIANEKWGSLAPMRCNVEPAEVWRNGVRTGTTYIVVLDWVKLYDEDRDAVLVDTEVEEFAELLYLMGVEEVEFTHYPYGKYEFRDERKFRQFCGLSE